MRSLSSRGSSSSRRASAATSPLLQRRHGGAERTVADHRAVEQLDDGGFVCCLASPRGGERRPALGVRLPFESALADQQLDQGQRATVGGSMQCSLAAIVMARTGAGGKQRVSDGHPHFGWRVGGTGLPQRRAGRSTAIVKRLTVGDEAPDGRQIACPRGRGERRKRCGLAAARRIDATHQVGPGAGAIVGGDLALRLGKPQRLVAGQPLGLLAQMFLGRTSGKLGHDSPFPKKPGVRSRAGKVE